MAKQSGGRTGKKQVRCPVETAIEAIGGRWKVLVIHHLLDGTQRFGALARLLRGISARTLTKQLRELERSGLIQRVVHRQIPPKVEYSLTDLGRALEPILLEMHEWGERLERRSLQTAKRC
jgi:DNA-binding HxlR family transcriptional regulator